MASRLSTCLLSSIASIGLFRERRRISKEMDLGWQSFVEQHGGQVGVVSREGEGTQFTVILPLAVAGSDETSQPMRPHT